MLSSNNSTLVTDNRHSQGVTRPPDNLNKDIRNSSISPREVLVDTRLRNSHNISPQELRRSKHRNNRYIRKPAVQTTVVNC